MNKRILSLNEKAFVKEVSKCVDINYLNFRTDYIQKLLLYYAQHGKRQFYEKNRNVKFTFEEMKFYDELLKERKKLLLLNRERENKRYSDLDLI